MLREGGSINPLQKRWSIRLERFIRAGKYLNEIERLKEWGDKFYAKGLILRPLLKIPETFDLNDLQFSKRVGEPEIVWEQKSEGGFIPVKLQGIAHPIDQFVSVLIQS